MATAILRDALELARKLPDASRPASETEILEKRRADQGCAHRRRPHVGTLVALAFAAALAACTLRPAEHFYTVSAESSVPDPGAAAQRIVVSPIVMPALIDRPQLVVRTGGHEIAVLGNHPWAESLSVDLTRALVNDAEAMFRLAEAIGKTTPERLTYAAK